jgi:hypothetical protein
MQAAQAIEPRLPQTRTIQHGQDDLRRIADDDVFNVAFAIDEHADLPTDFMRDLCQLAREFRRNNLSGRYAALVELFEPFELVGFESERFAFDVWNSWLPLIQFKIRGE